MYTCSQLNREPKASSTMASYENVAVAAAVPRRRRPFGVLGCGAVDLLEELGAAALELGVLPDGGDVEARLVRLSYSHGSQDPFLSRVATAYPRLAACARGGSCCACRRCQGCRRRWWRGPWGALIPSGDVAALVALLEQSPEVLVRAGR